ncbi:unnamed protein product [Clonostachys chloroleuca]|uniref:Increased rDNA silencing protein 4 n=1 Tax=Clonostachys chloroleuca TaxID=1926264 RepID=A0AA35LYK4_9HYPO|nr:unnamed protein product [Clonostachys chloroleuca]
MSYGAPHAPGGGASSDPAAALRGASLAFSKKKPPAPPPPSKGSSGALAAATLSSQSTGGSVNGLPDMDAAAARSIVAGRMQQLAAASGQQQHPQYGSHLQTPPRVDPKSTSFIAATLAASRNGSPSPPKPAAASPAPRRKASVGAMSSVSSVDVAVDSEPIPPTGSLISIFEGGRGGGGGGDPVKKTPVRGKRSVDETVAFRREPPADEGVASRAAEKKPLKTEPKSQAIPPRLENPMSKDRTDTRDKPKGDRGQAPAPPKPRGSSKPLAKVSSNRDTDSPEPIGLHRTKTTDTMDSANDVFVSAPTSPELAKSAPAFPPRHRKAASGPPSPTRDVQRQRSTTASSTNKNQALDSLTSAIMAGSLAAARLTPHSTGTSLPPPVTPIRQKSPRLRQTLRGPVDSSDDEEDRHKKNHRHKLRSGKHAHHEGSRRRWRDEVTTRERKRYEAVWASNRGIHLPHAASPSASSLSSSGRDNLKDFSHSVANVVVREVWKRSRLPEDELIEVWDLVDRDKRGVLSRQEFVVGMWLIDQRLKGRKIPTKVSESVWGSASGNGLMVIKPKAK